MDNGGHVKYRWSNLKDNRCPQCSKMLPNFPNERGVFECFCGFKIRKERFQEIVGDIMKNMFDKKRTRMIEHE